MTIGDEPICIKCTRYHKNDNSDFKCDAYPDGIPFEIIMGDVDHHEPYKGDHGLQFKPI